MIRDRQILVNGSLAEIGMKVNPYVDSIYVNGKKLKNTKLDSHIILLNKPKKVVTTCSDKHNRVTVMDLLPEKYRKGFFPIGRLDFLSRGALLITNDGTICYKLSHPKFEHKKIYLVKINGNLKESDLAIWRSGINLDKKKTNPCEIEIIEKDSPNFLLKITLNEGRNRQIRRVASLFGYKVMDLQRVNFANIALGNLEEGEWRLIDYDDLENI